MLALRMWSHPSRIKATQTRRLRSPDMRDAIYRADARTLHAQTPRIDLQRPGSGPGHDLFDLRTVRPALERHTTSELLRLAAASHLPLWRRWCGHDVQRGPHTRLHKLTAGLSEAFPKRHFFHSATWQRQRRCKFASTSASACPMPKAHGMHYSNRSL